MTNPIRGPEAEWVDSECPVCGSSYFGAALEYAQRLHDNDIFKKCAGRLRATSEPTPPPPHVMMWCYCLFPGCGERYEIGASTEADLLLKYAQQPAWYCKAHQKAPKRRPQKHA